MPVQFNELVREQAGLITRRQLRQLGVSRAHERTQLRAGRWGALNASVLCTHNGPLNRLQMMWAAVLSCRGLVALCGLTAFERHGVIGLVDEEVHILVAKGARPIPVPGVQIVVHESRRFQRVGRPATDAADHVSRARCDRRRFLVA